MKWGDVSTKFFRNPKVCDIVVEFIKLVADAYVCARSDHTRTFLEAVYAKEMCAGASSASEIPPHVPAYT
jgi:hypothetical protein